jgi:hypothetical protein
VLKVRPGNRYITDGMMHTIALHLNNASLSSGVGGTLVIDGNTHAFDAPPGGTREKLELAPTALYVGGLDRHNHYNHHRHSASNLNLIPRELWSAGLRYGYVGCMQNMRVNNERMDLASLAQQQEVEGVSEYCSNMGEQCKHTPCMHKGQCREGWNRFVCDCAATGYIGHTCNEGRQIYASYAVLPVQYFLCSTCTSCAVLPVQYFMCRISCSVLPLQYFPCSTSSAVLPPQNFLFRTSYTVHVQRV